MINSVSCVCNKSIKSNPSPQSKLEKWFDYVGVVFVGGDDRSQCVGVNAGGENVDWNRRVQRATRVGIDHYNSDVIKNTNPGN
jgi:hypothetical protein